MIDAFICSAVRTPVGRYGGALANVRTDDLATWPIRAIVDRNPSVDWEALDDVLFGCANQAGEDNRNVARMASLLAGLPETVSGSTINRLCGSGMDTVAQAARAVRTGEQSLVLAGGVESMSRAPFVLGKAEHAFDRAPRLEDTTMGWRFVNPLMKARFGVDSMPQTAENVASEFGVSRADQDAFALRSQQRAAAAIANGVLAEEICPVRVPVKRADPIVVREDEHPRPETSADILARLKPLFGPDGTITAGNASGINDGAAGLLIASESAAAKNGLKPEARVVAAATAGVPPRIMGMGPVPATEKVLAIAGLSLDEIDVIELNEAFAAQALAVCRELGIEDDSDRVNPNGGAIALGHPLGMSGARLVITATREMVRRRARYALCTMCIGVGQGIALILERA